MTIYLDNNATTCIAPSVVEVMHAVLRDHYGNPASNTHPQGWHAQEIVEIAREHVAALIGATPGEIIFTSGATESNNLAIKGIAFTRGLEETKILSCCTEHRSVLDPIVSLERSGAQSSLLEVNSRGEIDREEFKDRVASLGPTLISLMLANNEIGTVHPIATLSRDREGAFFHCDATQALGKIPVNVDELGVDMLSISAHKVYGPKGVGALYVRKKNLRMPLTPLIDGGGHEEGLRSGTLNVPGIVGFGEACRLALSHINSEGEQLRKRAQLLLELLQSRIPGIHINGPESGRLPGNLNIAIDRVSANRLIGKINTKLSISSSSACSSASPEPSHVLSSLGFARSRQVNSIRLGVGRFTSEEELIKAAEILAKAVADIRDSQASD